MMRRELLELAERWTLIATAFGFAPPMMPDFALLFATEILRLQAELAIAEHTNATIQTQLDYERRARAVAEGELADMSAIARSMAHPDANTSALIDAIEIAEAAGRRGLLTQRERERLRELRRAVPS